MSNPLYLAAAALSLMAAAIHGGAGERLVVTRLPAQTLPATRFGGPAMSLLMIRVTWHIATLVFAAAGVALALCSWGSTSSSCAGLARFVAVCFGGFFLLAFGLVVARRKRFDLRPMLRHPGPLVFAAVAVLAWIGSV
ncbi:MAG TPA: hypothetical protein VKA30_12610 [Actinomycetota bacterium]|nr:hypothetical protein [Actinomycetota bacterium]